MTNQSLIKRNHFIFNPWISPTKTGKPCRQPVLCGSHSDVFDKDVPQQWRDALFSLIHATPNIHWLLLTKSSGNAHITDAVCSLPYVDIVRPPPPHPLPSRSTHNGTRN
ncbi:DUF5131 family protein [Xylella fastidiosa]|uniref:DUF5131 family protein n=1 Tax=Xylella fastidiosa TaxID=2371 RepID=UPI001F4DFCC4|nr:DUF5131 family protein [Xylella fastidiosa]